jgi:hypothetical protein
MVQFGTWMVSTFRAGGSALALTAVTLPLTTAAGVSPSFCVILENERLDQGELHHGLPVLK